MLLKLFPFVILNYVLAFVYAYIWASQLVFSDVLYFDTSLLLLTVTLRGYLISIAYCLFFISVGLLSGQILGNSCYMFSLYFDYL